MMKNEVEEAVLVKQLGLPRDRLRRMRVDLLAAEDWYSGDRGAVVIRQVGLRKLVNALRAQKAEEPSEAEIVASAVVGPDTSSAVAELAEDAVERRQRSRDEVKVVEVLRIKPRWKKQMLGIVEGRQVRVLCRDVANFKAGMRLRCRGSGAVYRYTGKLPKRRKRGDPEFFQKGD